ncbi:class I SAM-dependent methyltransferase [Salmonella enterica]|nr:class I SAM-dependent methyltransferase [Salmonella enterica]EBK1958077.1 class I SAM-dependent methyltransferase [Salmonella enterica subsp. enterica serovar Newport]ECI4612317.1 class I SAM-dependent methyltransferase [Salmonella enterica subsp. diarizonae]EFO5651298.1 class I SAM-dependent methyltransferase [Salmonella enterica subsp. enterica serovar Miami]EAT1016407.1 class I SAM-dependent methyltransferase [Salmonella enterica]
MALMFPRLARNFVRNGYFPTDEATLERILAALAADNTAGPVRLLDPCAGEGVAVTELACHLGEQAQAYAVEYDAERAAHCATMADVTLHGDLMDTIISPQAFSLLFLNPPYGDLVKDHEPDMNKKGRARLEKQFYRRCVDNLMYDGILVLIIPYYTLDREFCGWLANSFTDVRIFSAVTDQFKQVVIFGRRIRQHRQNTAQVRQRFSTLTALGKGDETAVSLPEVWSSPYCVPAARQELKHFYRVTMEPVQLEEEIRLVRGLWPSLSSQLCIHPQPPRPPARRLSRWHLALALAAGAITGVITSPAGRTLVVRGDTCKVKDHKTEFTEDDDGNISETIIMTDRFIPAISAWDMTPDSPTFGELLSIH